MRIQITIRKEVEDDGEAERLYTLVQTNLVTVPGLTINASTTKPMPRETEPGT